MKKQIILFLIFAIILASIIFVTLKIEPKEAIGIKDYNQLTQKQQREKIEVIGNISEISFDFLTLMDIEFPEHDKTFEIKNRDSGDYEFGVGQTVLVKVYLDKDEPNAKILEIDEIELENALRYLKKIKPMIEISILEFPEELDNPCQEINLILALDNTGNKAIRYDEIYDESYGYSLFYILNKSTFAYQMVEDFEIIKPGETKNVKFTIVNPDILEEKNKLQFFWGQKSLLEEDFEILTQSETAEILVQKTSCD